MDLVLETCDTFVFDKVYSYLLPTELAATVSQPWAEWLDLSTITHVSNAVNAVNGTSNLLDAIKENVILQNTMRNGSSCPEIYGYTPFLWDVTEATFKSMLPRHNLLRELISLWLITMIFGWLLYLSMATFSYMFVFDRSIFNHPRYLQNQMRQEIKLAISAIPLMSLLTVPWFMLECNGYSKLYFSKPNMSLKTIIKEIIAFIFFTDCGVYWAHRWLHWPKVYRALHKPHHKWLVCTPFASHAFHPLDGYGQSISYHVYPMIMPLQKGVYLGLFTFVNFWTIMIHDGNHMYNNKIVNGTACHTVHHLYFSYNFGQFTTLWDRLGGSYRRPEDALFDKSAKNDTSVLAQQLQQMDEEMEMLEGADERVYDSKKQD
ncbi:delta(7)-sterol 5(6)-desaturase Erg3p [Monosporozyma servazzii]